MHRYSDKDKGDIYPVDFLTLSDRPGRRNSLKLYKKRNYLDLCKHSFTSRVVDRWNALPDEVVLSADVNVCKGRLDYHMRDVRGQTCAHAWSLFFVTTFGEDSLQGWLYNQRYLQPEVS